MSKTCRKAGHHKINGSTNASSTSGFNSSLVTTILALFFISCSTSQKTSYSKNQTMNICTLGEGKVSIKYNGKSEYFDISFKKGPTKWLFGVEVPLKGEQVFWIDNKNNASSNISKFLPTYSKEAKRLLQMLFPIGGNSRDTSDLNTKGGAKITQIHNLSSKGDFKALLIKDIFFIKRTYAQLDFRVTACSKQEKFQIIKN